MTWEVFVTVFTFGGIGATVRGLVLMILSASNGIFPIGIVMVNLLASFLGAFILRMQLPHDIALSLSAGLVGGIGTLSAVNTSFLDLFFDRGKRRIAIFLALTVFLGLLAAGGGGALGGMIQEMIVNQYVPDVDQQMLHMDDLHLPMSTPELPLPPSESPAA